MKSKAFCVMILLVTLTACGKTPSPAGATESAATQQTIPETTVAETSEEEPWKAALAEDLFQKYGVLPEYYEDLGDGIYQVYVEVGSEIVPFVTVNSTTGDYHG